MKYLKYFIFLLIILVAFVSWIYRSEPKEEYIVEEYEKVIEKINDAINKSSEPIFIFDRNNNFISSFGNNLSIKDTPKYLLNKIKDRIDDVYKHSANMFLSQVYSPSTEDIDGCAAYLKNKIENDNIINYILSYGSFGNECVGIVNASYYYFNKPIIMAEDKEIDYLVDILFNGTNIDYSNYSDIEFFNKPSTYGYSSNILKSLVSAEMVRHTSGFSLSGCAIKIGVNKELQEEISRSLLQHFRTYIEQDSSGVPYLNGSVIVLDKSIGLISCYVPSAGDNSNIFSMNVKDLEGNLKQLYSKLNADLPLWFSLDCYDESDGTSTYDSLKFLFDNQMFYKSDKLSLASVLDVCSMLFGSNIEYREPELIAEIRKDNNLIYNSKQNLLNNFNVAEAHICEFFRKSEDNNTEYGYDLFLSTGLVSFRVNNNYAVVMLLGTNSINGNLTAVEKDDIIKAKDSMYNIITKYYHISDDNIWFVDDLDNLKQTVYDNNAQLLSPTFNKYIKALDSLAISSKEEKQMFEDLYERGLNFIEYYKDSLGEVHYKESLDRLSTIRVKRNIELLKYSV